ncbi:N-6 DNA methylase [Thermaerobacter subterraneus]|uniref:Type I restriction-modification system methyltransferase subunit n=1 Tax=Thermaerobacter subterraneus DSM 13965 TaxID=867903 RepID=K6P262_9FIRM|nr:N-6 DNA methylase [Thermaerobacter subterraneus]EKP95155.1 type I restriction-modification system methyltransferase subunit [Thermaerobacter subterraneus DSM 13965]
MTNLKHSLTAQQIEAHPLVREAVARGFIKFSNNRITYHLNQKKEYNWFDPEEWVRCHAIAWLIIEKGYPANRIRTEVAVPRRVPEDHADIVVFEDDRCRIPYLVVETKAAGQGPAGRRQGIEQLFGNANSLRAPLGLYDEYTESFFYDIANYPPTERNDNLKGSRDAVPDQYGRVPKYTYIAGSTVDIRPVDPGSLETRIRRAHSIIWAGGKRDPLTAFDEWSKLLFAKVQDERTTPNGEPRKFQVGTNETSAAVASRIHKLFEDACQADPTIFPEGVRIELSDRKIVEVVRVLQDISITATHVDSIGKAFESFFGSIFRGELGQYFTMRQLARFIVAMLDIDHRDYVIDPTAGSGGFLLEVLLQVWHKIDKDFAGRSDLERLKIDFALHKVYGIEIHPVLARICKINLLLHHDGHTNIEGDRSCLDSIFNLPRLNPPTAGRFTRVVGNPPFGDTVKEGDEDLLGQNSLSNFHVAEGRTQVPSEHVILERAIQFLADGGRLGLIIPDGILNNPGDHSNCPQVRRFLVMNGVIEAIVSLPDYAFRKSGAQNKTSILFFRKFEPHERVAFKNAYDAAREAGKNEEEALIAALEALNYPVFLAEANYIGYTATGVPSERNDLYRSCEYGILNEDQSGTILGEYRRFRSKPDSYDGHRLPDCMAASIVDIWRAHESHRLDPKYHLFKREERTITPKGWIRRRVAEVMRRREEIVRPQDSPYEPVVVMTISQTGEIRAREAGKGNNPPEWLGMYFEDSSSVWYRARKGDVVFSAIDLWKGCIAVVPEEFDGALVTKEFPIYEIIDERLDPEFLSTLLRTRYYQRAFRAITTGHSNRRRTQTSDFEALEICFPPDRRSQTEIIADILRARQLQREANNLLRQAMLRFSDLIDGRGDMEYIVPVDDDENDENE